MSEFLLLIACERHLSIFASCLILVRSRKWSRCLQRDGYLSSLGVIIDGVPSLFESNVTFMVLVGSCIASREFRDVVLFDRCSVPRTICSRVLAIGARLEPEPFLSKFRNSLAWMFHIVSWSTFKMLTGLLQNVALSASQMFGDA